MPRRKINPLIWEEIEKYPMEDNIRDFLKEVLMFERNHISEQKPRYSDEYEKLIEKYSKTIKEESYENP